MQAMKRQGVWVIPVLVFTLLWVAGFQRTRAGDPIQSHILATQLSPWIALGTITVTQATPAVDARDYSAVWGLTGTKTITWDVPNEATGFMWRFSTTANADSHVVEVWVAADDYLADGTTEDAFLLGAILTLTGGQQVGVHSDYFVDTIAVTNYALDLTVLDSAADRMCVVQGDLKGFKKVVMIATTLQSKSTIYSDGRIW